MREYTMEQRLEQAITGLELANIEAEQTITELDLRICELESEKDVE